MEEDEEDEEESECEDKIADKMETVEALLSLSEASRSPVGSPEKPLITILPAHNPDKGEATTRTERGKYLVYKLYSGGGGGGGTEYSGGC